MGIDRHARDQRTSHRPWQTSGTDKENKAPRHLLWEQVRDFDFKLILWHKKEYIRIENSRELQSGD